MKIASQAALLSLAFLLSSSSLPGQQANDDVTLESLIQGTKLRIVGKWQTDKDATVAYIEEFPQSDLKTPSWGPRVSGLTITFAKDGTMNALGPNQTADSASARYVVTVAENRETYFVITYQQFGSSNHQDDGERTRRPTRTQLVVERFTFHHGKLVTFHGAHNGGIECTVYSRSDTP